MPIPIEDRLAALCSPAIVPGLERTRSLLKLLGALEDNDDIQTVAANFEVADDVMARLTA